MHPGLDLLVIKGNFEYSLLAPILGAMSRLVSFWEHRVAHNVQLSCLCLPSFHIKNEVMEIVTLPDLDGDRSYTQLGRKSAYHRSTHQQVPILMGHISYWMETLQV